MRNHHFEIVTDPTSAPRSHAAAPRREPWARRCAACAGLAGSLLALACGEIAVNNDAAPSIDAAPVIDAAPAIDAAPSIDATPATVVPTGGIVMFDDVCPPGWAEVTGIQERYLRGHDGDTTFGETGGTRQHNHTVASHFHSTSSSGGAHTHAISASAGIGVLNLFTLPSVNGAPPDHTHAEFTSSSGGSAHTHNTNSEPARATSSVTNLPAFREVIFCKAVLDATSYPQAALLLSEQMCSGEWSEDMSFRDRLIRGHDRDSELQEVGGNDNHTHSWMHNHGGTTNSAGSHSHSGTMPAATGSNGGWPGGGSVAAPGHTHAYALNATGHTHSVASHSGNLGSSDMVPQYREVVVCSHSGAARSRPAGALLLADGSCPEGWIESIMYRNHFLRGHDGDAELGETGGSDTHSHSAAHSHGTTSSDSHTHTFSHGGPSNALGVGPFSTGVNVNFSPSGHSHAPNVSSGGSHSHNTNSSSPDVSSASSVPEFYELTVCRPL